MLVDDYVKKRLWSTKDQPKRVTVHYFGDRRLATSEAETGVDEVGALVDTGFIHNH